MGFRQRALRRMRAKRAAAGPSSAQATRQDLRRLNQELNKRMLEASSATGVLEICGEHLQSFDAVNVATAIMGIAKRTHSAEATKSPEFNALVAAAAGAADAMMPGNLAFTFWSCARLSVRDPALFEALASASLCQMYSFRPHELSSLAWACAKVEFAESRLLEGIATVATRNVKKCDARSLSNLAWAFAKLNHEDAAALAAISGRSLDVMYECGEQDLSNLAWASANLRLKDKSLLGAMCCATVVKIGRFTEQGITNTMWAFATLNFVDDALVKAVSRVASPRMAGFKEQELSSFAWALATLGIRDDALLTSLSSVATQKISGFDPQGLGNLAWACACLRIEDEALLGALSAAIVKRVDKLNHVDVTNVAWAFATLGIRDDPLVYSLAEAAVPMMRKSEQISSECADKSQDVDLDVLALVHAFASMGSVQQDLINVADEVLRNRARQLDARCIHDNARPRIPEHLKLGHMRDGEVVDDYPPLEHPAVLFDQPNVCVLWKPPKWLHTGGEDVDFLPTGASRVLADAEGDETAYRQGKLLQEWLASELGGSFDIANDPKAQFGLVHRLDCNTSGVLLCAKTYEGYRRAQLQFVSRRVRKEYVCVCHGHMPRAPHLITASLRQVAAETAGDPLITATCLEGQGQSACTEVCAVAHLSSPGGKACSLVELRLHTGRKHQIRAHLASMGCPLFADPTYGGKPLGPSDRVFLHAHRLSLDIGDGLIDVSCPLPSDLRRVLASLKAEDEVSEVLLTKWLQITC